MHPMALLLALQVIAEPAAVRQSFHGRQNQTVVDPPRIEAEVVIDGVLDEPVWGQSAVLTGFSQYAPADGRAADDSTDVMVWYAPNAIYFGIRAFALQGSVRATLADRDKLSGDDNVQILLDTFDDRRQALVFAVNPLGVQADGVRSESQRGATRQGQVPDEDVDWSPDFVFRSKGRVTERGYEVEIRIPFKSLRYQTGATQQWRVNVVRKVQARGHELTWTPTRRADASFLSQSGTLRGLQGLSRGLVLDLNPEATSKIDGSRPGATGWEYDARRPEIGGNLRWGVTTNLSLGGTVNPDFSNIEADVAQAPNDPRFAVSFPEKRPFFLEGSERFETRNSLIYTRRIADPVGALKLAGKASNTSIGVLSALDDRGPGGVGDRPVFNILRLKRDVGAQSSLGLVYTDRVVGSDYNRLAVVDGRLVFGRIYSFEFQAGQSFTSSSGVSSRGPIWEGAIDANGRRFGVNFRFTGIHPDFQAQSGFVRRGAFIQPTLTARYTAYGRPGASLERFTTTLFSYGYWRYNDFFGETLPYEHQLGWQNNFVLKGGWTFRVNPIWESVDYDPDFFADYGVVRARVGGGLDTIPFVIHDRIHNWGIAGGFATPQLQRFSAGFSGIIAEDVIWFERRQALLIAFTPTLTWRPSDRLRVEGRYTHQQFFRMSDDSKFITAYIPRLKLEYQISRPIFIRLVGQYEARLQDAYRDPRDEQPILIRPGPGLPYAPTTRSQTNFLRVDWLFSYRPNPGTVIFLGYGSSMTENDAFSFRHLTRTSDGFFAKLSYLFRL